MTLESVTRKASAFFDLDPSRVWSIEQVRFSEEARAAARRALYSTRMLDPGFEEPWAEFLLNEVRHQLAPVLVPRRAACCSAEGGTNPGECDFKGADVSFPDLLLSWYEMCRLADVRTGAWPRDWELSDRSVSREPSEDREERLRELDERLVRFLEDSQPASVYLRITYVWIPAALDLLKQYMGLLVGLTLSAMAALGLEAVRSLYRNNVAITIGCLSAVVAVPAVMAAVASWSRRRRRHTPFWDRGGRLYRSFAPYPLAPAPWRTRHPSISEGHQVMLGRGLSLVMLVSGWAFTGLFGTAVAGFGLLDQVNLTVYAITGLLATIIALGATADFVDLHSQPPIRRSIVIGLGLYVACILWFDSPVAGIVVLMFWMVVLLVWAGKVGFRQIRPVYAVIFLGILTVLSSTYGRRLAERWRPVAAADASYSSPDSLIGDDLWPAGQGLSRPPPVVVMAASGGGSRAAIYTAKTLEALAADLPEVSQNLQAIGSVSGGSLANAAYVADRIDALGEATRPVCDGSLVERMSGDFLRPVMEGVVFSLKGRGPAIESHWEGCPVGLGGTRLSNLARTWRTRVAVEGDTLPPFPLPLFHSVSLMRHAVVLSPLAKEMYRVSDIEEEAMGRETNQYSRLSELGRPTWVYYRSGLYGLEELLPGFDPRLSKVVRASANFPFGFPLVEVLSPQPLYLSPWDADREPESTKLVRLTDGGALSNSGMWALYHLLTNQESSLRERGVLLLLVDASAMPEAPTPNRMTGLAAVLLDKHPKGEFLHRSLLSGLAATFGGCFDAVELEIRAVRNLNVHTTWALDERSVGRLDEAFDAEWGVERKEIASRFQSLRRCDPEADSPWNRGSRVPIS